MCGRSGCCSGSLPSRRREAGINGFLPATRVPSIYSVSPLRVLDRSLPEQREVTVICVRKILANLRSANLQTVLRSTKLVFSPERLQFELAKGASNLAGLLALDMPCQGSMSQRRSLR